MANRYCSNCGHSLAPDDRFCAGCAKPVQETPEAEAPASLEPRESPETVTQNSERREPIDPNIRAEDYWETPSHPSWWRWIFRGGS
jgi:predicted amidophosphoribosyltransferase